MSKPTWRNWAGNQHSNASVLHPKDLDALREAVVAAARPTPERPQPRIRAAGGSYSWAPLVTTDDTIIVMEKLDRLLELDVPNCSVVVEAGMTIAALDQIARENGLTLITPTLFPLPTVGGAIAAGCHGTSSTAGSFSDDVLELTIVRADGKLKTVRMDDPDDPHSRNFRAAQVALGSLGIVYSVKLKLAKQFNVRTEKRELDANTVLANFDDLIASNDFLELFWFPFVDTIWVYCMNRTDSLPDPKTWWTRLSQGVTTAFENGVGGRVVPWMASHLPNATPLFSKLANWGSNHEGSTVQLASDAFHFQKAYPKCWDMEYAFPIEHTARVWRTMHDLVMKYAGAGLYPINLALHGRFSAAGRGWLAPDSERATCYVEVTTAEPTPNWREFYMELEKRWLEIPGARPHWCKLYFQPRVTAGLYPHIGDFLKVREEWDPERVFLNEFLEHDVFQLPARELP